MSELACTYALLDEGMSPIYIGMTRNLRTRLGSHKSKLWFSDVRFVGLKFYRTRLLAEVGEALDICRSRPAFNRNYYPFCSVIKGGFSGRPPNSSRPMSHRDKTPPYYFGATDLSGPFEKLYFRDASSEAAGFNSSKRRPNIAPRGVRPMIDPFSAIPRNQQAAKRLEGE